jgi:peptide methionine sulfoxide reductase MsrB
MFPIEEAHSVESDRVQSRDKDCGGNKGFVFQEGCTPGQEKSRCPGDQVDGKKASGG